MITPVFSPGIAFSCSFKDRGYGPQGKHSRTAWRDECLTNLRAGKDQFKVWQESWKDQINQSLEKVTFAVTIANSDGTERVYLGYAGQEQKPYSLDFMMVDFDNVCNLHSYDFTSAVFFCGSTFTHKAVFENVTFHADAHFEEASFSSRSGVSFRNASFKGIADFSVQNFKHEVDFSGATFEKDAIFLSSEFNWVNFNNATFKEAADFNENIFNGDCYFVGVEFHKEANFFKSEFKRQSRFNFDSIENKKNGNQDRETKFFSIANFENTKFENIGHFERVRFISMTPNFRGSKIGETRLEFSDDSYFPQDEKGEDAVRDISFLKRLSEEHGQTEQALNFNALELRSKAASDNASWNFKIVTWFYKHLSDFGRSFLIPLTIYAVILFVTFLIALEHSAFNAPRNYTQKGCEKYVWWIERVTWVGDINCKKYDKEESHKLTGVRAAGEYTLYRAVGVLDFADSDKQTIQVANRLFGQDYEPWWMRIYGIFKAIASTALLFLAALGLRNKYRIK